MTSSLIWPLLLLGQNGAATRAASPVWSARSTCRPRWVANEFFKISGAKFSTSEARSSTCPSCLTRWTWPSSKDSAVSSDWRSSCPILKPSWADTVGGDEQVVEAASR